MRPTDDHLRRFLLGVLAPAEAERVARWVETAPDAVEHLGRLEQPDSLAVALARPGGTPFPSGPETVSNLVRLAEVVGGSHPTPTLPGYRFVRELGRGGMGAVYEAVDETLARRVAVKLMLPAVAAKPEAKERFLREARSLAAVDSEFIVPLFHVGETPDGAPYLVMPLLAGETLESRLDRGPLAAGELTAVARDAARGLATAHAVGLIHRDVKPSNLWLEADEHGRFRRARLLDFGLARPTDTETAMTATGQLVGTPAYMSPEQARNLPLTPATDLFSLGAVLYRAAAGRRPFAGDTPSALLTALAVDDPAPVGRFAPHLPPPLAGLIHALLHKDPARRPTAAEVARRVEATPAAVRRRPTRGPLIALAAAFLFVAVVFAGVTVVIIRDKDGKKVAEVTVPDRGTVSSKEGDGPEKPLLPAAPTGAEPKETAPVKPAVPNSPPPPPKPIEPGKPLSPRALTQEPKEFDGIASWTVETKRPRGFVTVAAYSPDGKRLAVSGRDGTIRILDAKTFEVTQVIVGMGEHVDHLAWLPKGDRLFAGTFDGDAVVWEYPGGKKAAVLDVPRGYERFALSPDGKQLLAGNHLFDPATGKKTGLLKAKAVGAAVWHPDGKLLAAGSNYNHQFSTLEVIDAEKNENVEAMTGTDTGDRPVVYDWSPDGKRLLAGWSQKRLVVYEGDEKKELPVHNTGARFAPDGKRVLVLGHTWVSIDPARPDDKPVEFVGTKQFQEEQLSVSWSSVDVSADHVAVAASTRLLVFDKELKPIHSGKPFDGLKTNAAGHYRVKAADEAEVVYVIQTEKGQEMLTPAEFEKRTGWKNDPSKVGLPK